MYDITQICVHREDRDVSVYLMIYFRWYGCVCMNVCLKESVCVERGSAPCHDQIIRRQCDDIELRVVRSRRGNITATGPDADGTPVDEQP